MSGRLRLAATGVQDQWLTGDPQFSYFLMNFRRHTKFAIDYIETQFEGSDLDFGKTRMPISNNAAGCNQARGQDCLLKEWLLGLIR